MLLRSDAGLATFRVLITTCNLQGADNTATICKPRAKRREARTQRSGRLETRTNPKPAHLQSPLHRSVRIGQHTASSNCRNPVNRSLHGQFPASRILSAPHSPRIVTRPQGSDRQVDRTSSFIQIVVRIQENRHGQYSRRYNKTVLYQKTNKEFYDWFASRTQSAYPSGPLELKFTFKDALPEVKSSTITRENEEHFEYMKRDIEPQCKWAIDRMPEMIEFLFWSQCLGGP